jgi:hypothetical protein
MQAPAQRPRPPIPDDANAQGLGWSGRAEHEAWLDRMAKDGKNRKDPKGSSVHPD